MKQLKTQCYLIRETTMKAVRQRQPSFSLLANGSNMPLPLERKPKPSCCDLDNTSTAILQDRRPLRARNHLRAWCPIQRPGTAGIPIMLHKTEPHAFKHCQKGPILRENSLGEKRGTDLLAE